MELMVQSILQTNTAAANLPDDSLRTPLHDASSRDYSDVMAILIHAGARLEAKDKAGETTLHVAAQETVRDTVSMPVKAGSNINARDGRWTG